MSTNRKKTSAPSSILTEEIGALHKRGHGKPAIALAYPNTYFLGMSNLGLQTLYALLNSEPETICERVFLPDEVITGKSVQRKNLRTLESGREIVEFDALAFSISFENDYLYVLNMLDLAGITFFSKDRNENDPIVIAGGAAITINPEPIRDFIDVLFVGEAEEAATEIAAVLRLPVSRNEKLEALAEIKGCYLSSRVKETEIPALAGSICPTSSAPNRLEERVSLAHLRQYVRRVPEDINGHPVETVIHTPYSEFGKLSLIEVQRGCGRGCKFCAEGFIYTPFRQRNFDLVKNQVLRGLQYRDRIGLIGADLLVYPEILELMKFIHAQGGKFSPSSVRVDALTPDIIEQLAISEHKTLAIAPEGGSDIIRKKLNKKFDNSQILNVVDQLIRAGIPNIKMYFMVGLPDETDDDISQMIELISEARQLIVKRAQETKRMGSLVISINPFIPKPRTPWQVGVFAGINELEQKISRIQKILLPKGGIRIYHENPFFAYIQALLSNGRKETSSYLLEVFKQGGLLRKSLKAFSLN